MLILNQYVGLGAGGVGALTTLTQVDSAVSAADTIVAPVTIIAGDLILLFDYGIGITPPTAVTPTGFTAIISHPSAESFTAVVSYKIADGTEAGATITGMNAAVVDHKVLLVFRGNVPIVLVSPLDVEVQGVSGNPTAQTVGAAAGTPPLLVIGAYGSDSAVDPRTFTVGGSAAKDGELDHSPGTGDVWGAWKIYNAGTAPDDVVIDMDDEGGNNFLGSFYLQCA